MTSTAFPHRRSRTVPRHRAEDDDGTRSTGGAARQSAQPGSAPIPHPQQRRNSMSARANPTAVGLFLLGALVIAIIGTAVLASGTWFQSNTTFISFFPESVNGLANGAPVKFQGVPVGRVT